MAEETLRRNLDGAFDPGPDFPDPRLLSRAMAAVDSADRAHPNVTVLVVATALEPFELPVTTGSVAVT